MSGNERILAILRALSAANPSSNVLHALAQVTGQALTVSSQSTQYLGQAYDASADSLDTLSFTGQQSRGRLPVDPAQAALPQHHQQRWPERRRHPGHERTAGRDPARRRQRVARRLHLARASAGVGQRRHAAGAGVLHELRHVCARQRRAGRHRAGEQRPGPGREPVRRRRALTLTTKLPAAAVTALGHGAKESATFTVTGTNGNGTGRATAKLAMLKGTK